MRALIIGAAVSGSAVAKMLSKKGYEVIVTDSKTIQNKAELESQGIIVEENGHPEYLKDLSYDLIVKNPGIPNDAPFVSYFLEKGYFLYNETEIASSFVNYRYASITGTNGKTTTTSILAEMLKTQNPHNAAVGNIGLPLSDIVLNHEKEFLTLAVEISAFQLLGLKNFHPEVSVCINLTPDHVDYFRCLDAYYRAKMLVYQNQGPKDWFLLNVDDENCVKYAQNIPCQVVTFSVLKEADLCIRSGSVYLFNQEIFSIKHLKIPGLHNVQNAMIAAAMAIKLGVPLHHIQKVLREFPGVKHRIQFVAEKKGVRYYNDSKGTNPDSTIVALKAFDRPVILLAGGYDKKTGFEIIKPYLPLLKKLIVYGETKYQLKELFAEAVVVDNLSDAVAKAKKIAVSGDVVLLSPMCASWDQYRNFEERGDHFIQLVEENS